jgi:hypothetical protein
LGGGPTAISWWRVLLRRGYAIEGLCSDVGVSTLDDLLHRLQPTQ